MGFRKGDSVSPMLFLWIIEDLHCDVNPELARFRCKVMLHGIRLEWPDGTLIIASNVKELERLVADLRAVAQQYARLQLRVRPDIAPYRLPHKSAWHEAVAKMQEFGGHRNLHPVRRRERLGVQGCCACCVADLFREKVWRTPGFPVQNIRALHLIVLVLTWCGGTRWLPEMKRMRTQQLQITQRACRCCLRADEGRATPSLRKGSRAWPNSCGKRRR